MKLFLAESSWNGRIPDYKPEIKKSEYELNKDVKNVVKVSRVSYRNNDGNYVEEEQEKFAFTITEIGDDFITIETNCPMSERDNGTINLLSKETTFRIEKDKKVKLTTISMDTGDIYTFELI